MSPFGSETRKPQPRHVMDAANSNKVLVRVRADHDTDGSIRPLSFLLPDGERVVVDRLLHVRQAASLKAGGQGLRYEVRVTCGDVSRELYLFDDDGVWFIEKD